MIKNDKQNKINYGYIYNIPIKNEIQNKTFPNYLISLGNYYCFNILVY